MLSKRARKGIQAFNRRQYRTGNLSYMTSQLTIGPNNVRTYVDTYLKLKGASNDQTHTSSGEVVG